MKYKIGDKVVIRKDSSTRHDMRTGWSTFLLCRTLTIMNIVNGEYEMVGDFWK